MIRLASGNILDSDADALVNTVNCVGVMGRGIALQFKNAFPDNFKAYAAACKRNEVQPGRMFVFDTGQLAPQWIINFPTKRHWRGKSKIEDIEAGLESLKREIEALKIKSIAIPPLGAGLGGLDWREVRPRIERALADMRDIDVVLYEPGASSPESPVAVKEPKMTAGRAALVGLARRYLGGLMEPWITLLEIHKLMYLLQEAGEPLRLDFDKGYQGPYASNLRHVLRAINGHLITGYTAEGDSPDEQIELVEGAVEKAEDYLTGHHKTQIRFERVTKVIEGFETPFGLELLATVHWVASKQGAQTAEEIKNGFYAWGQGKRRFSPRQIEIAIERLRSQGWIAAPSQ